MHNLFLILLCFTVAGLLRAEEPEADGGLWETILLTQKIPAEECYVLLTLKATGKTYVEALANYRTVQKTFAQKAVQTFPKIKIEEITVNMGRSGEPSYVQDNTPFEAGITKVQLCILPPEESAALKLLDLAAKEGLKPFCAVCNTRNNAGAVLYGIRNASSYRNSLYPEAVRQLTAKIKLAAKKTGWIVRQPDTLRSDTLFDQEEDVCSREGIHVRLPAEIWSMDKDLLCTRQNVWMSFLAKSKPVE